MEIPEKYSQLTQFILELFGGNPPDLALLLAKYEVLAYSTITFIPTIFVWLAKYYEKDKRKYSGIWKVHIYWKDNWAKQELGIAEPNDPYSEGTMILAYCDNPNATDYKGRGFFKLKNANKVLGNLTIEYTNIVLSRPVLKLFRHDLTEIKATTLLRYIVDSSDLLILNISWTREQNLSIK